MTTLKDEAYHRVEEAISRWEEIDRRLMAATDAQLEATEEWYASAEEVTAALLEQQRVEYLRQA